MAKYFWGNGAGMLTPSDAGNPASQDRPTDQPDAPIQQPARARGLAAQPAPKPVARTAPNRTIPEMPPKIVASDLRARSASERPSTAVADQGAFVAGDASPITRRAARERAQFDLPKKDEIAPRRGSSLQDMIGSVGFVRRAWFVLAFLAPIVLGTLYLFLLAPDQFVTEYRFSVRSPVGQKSAGASAGGAITAALGGSPDSSTSELDNYTVADYVSSAQAARDLDAKVNLRTIFNKPSDPFSKIGEKPTTEELAQYWRSMVYSSYDVSSGLAVVRVKAYSAADSYAIATNLVTLSSDLVNSIGARSQQDTVRIAQQQLDRSMARVATLRGELSNLRNQAQVIDPGEGIVASNTALANQILGRRSQLSAQLETINLQLRNPKAPQVVLLNQQIAALTNQLAQVTQNGGAGVGQPPRAVTVGRFEDINGQLKDALATQANATAAMSAVQASSDAQRIYLTTYVQPSLPESPQAPNRWIVLLIIVLIAGMAWLVGRLVGNSIMDHA
jgi:capsular polysaccharide transport system permease protein